MSEPNAAAPTVPPPPRCPHCGTDLPGLAFYNWAIDIWLIMSVSCPHPSCLKVLHMQVVPIAAMPVPGQPASKVVRPH